MSANKKNNKKNRRNNYKIESLEPRLMMDATIASWNDEATLFKVLPTTNVDNWLGETLQNVSKVDPSTDSKYSLQVKDVLDSKIDSNDYDEIRKRIVDKFHDAVTAFKKEKIKEYKAANSDASDKDAENAVAGQLFKASEIVDKMSSFSKVNDWSISFRADGSNPDVIVFTVSKKGSRTQDDLDAFVARNSNLNVNLESLEKDNVEYSAKFDILFDINSSDYIKNEEYDVKTKFNQIVNVVDGRDKAIFGAIELKSVEDSGTSGADYAVGIKTDSTNSGKLSQSADFDFKLDSADAKKLSGDFDIIKNKHLKYTYANNSWKWSAEGASVAENNQIDSLMQGLASSNMGLIVSKLTALSMWLSNCQNITENNPEPLFKNDMDGLLAQNLSENINISSMLGLILGQNLKSLSDLSKFVAASKTIEKNGNILTIPLKFELNKIHDSELNKDVDISSKVSLLTQKIEDLGFTIKSSESLNCTSTASLEFTLEADLARNPYAKSSNKLEDIGVNDSSINEVFNAPVVVAPDAIGFATDATSDGKFKVDVAGTAKDVEIDTGKDFITTLSSFVTDITGYHDAEKGINVFYSSKDFKFLSEEPSGTAILSEFGLLNAKSTAGTIIKVDWSDFDPDEELCIKLKDASGKTLTIDEFYCEEKGDLASAIMAAIADEGSIKGASVYLISDGTGDYLVLSNLNWSVESLKCDGDSLVDSIKKGFVVVSSQLGIEKPAGNVEISFTLDSAAPIKVIIEATNLSAAKNITEIAQVINDAIAKNQPSIKDDVIAFVCDGKIGFKSSPKNPKNISVSFNKDAFGFKASSTYAETDECIEITITHMDVSGPKDYTVSFGLKKSSLSKASTLNEVFDAIVNQANDSFYDAYKSWGIKDPLKYKPGSVKIAANSGYSIKEIKNINGYTLAALLGISGKREDECEFSLNAILDSARNNVKYKDLKLVINQTVTGEASMDAALGGVAVDITGSVGNLNNSVVVELNGQLPNVHILAQKGQIERENLTIQEKISKIEFLIKENFSSLSNTELDDYKLLNDDLCLLKNSFELYTELVDGFESGYVLSCDYNDVNLYIQTFEGLIKSNDLANLKIEYSNFKKWWNVYSADLASDLNNCANKAVALYNNALVKCTVTKSSVTKPTLQFNTNSGFDSKGQLNSAVTLGSLALKNATWTASTVKKDYLENLQNFDVDLVLKAISAKIRDDVSQKLDGLSICNFDIPFVGKSFSDVFGIYAKFNDLVNKFDSAGVGSYQELFELLKNRLDVNLKYDIDFKSKTNQKITFDLNWQKTITNQKLELGNLAASYLGGNFFGGAFEAYISGSVSFNLRIVVQKNGNNYDVGIEKIDSSKDLVACKFTVKSDLAGDFSANIKGSSTSLLKIVNKGNDKSKLYLNTSCSLNLNKGSLEVTSALLTANALINLQALGCDVGYVCIGKNGTKGGPVTIDLNKVNKDNYSELFELRSNFGTSTSGGTAGTTASTYNGEKLVFDLTHLSVDFSKGTLFEKITMIANGLGEVLRKAQSGLNRGLLSDIFRNIPLVGDRIISAADCITCLDEKLVEPFRKFVNKAEGLDAQMVAEALFNLIPNEKSLRLKQYNVATPDRFSVKWAGKDFNQIYKDCIEYYELRDADDKITEVGWRFTLTGGYDLDKDADFDLGFPGLGLKTEGGVSLGIGWELDIGFGLSLTEGAFLLLSDGSESNDTDEKAGDDLRISINTTLKDSSKIEGTLGFLNMIAKPNGKMTLGDVYVGVDLNDGNNSSEQTKAQDWATDTQGNKNQIAFTSIGSGINVDVNASAGLDLNLNLLLTAGNEFPSVSTDFIFEWGLAFGKSSDGLKKVGFSNVVFDAGEFLTKMVKPMLKKIKMVIDPMQPLIDFLQSEIPVLNKLPAGKIKITVLDLVKMYGNAKGMKFGFLDDLISLNNLIKNFNFGKTLGFKLPDLDLFDNSTGIRDSENKAGLGFLSGSVTNINKWVEDIKKTFGLASSVDVLDTIDKVTGKWIYIPAATDLAASLSSLPSDFGSNIGSGTSNAGNYGWAFPIFEDPVTNVFGLMFGRQADLVTYNMRPLEFKFDWGKSFPIVGPLCADISFNFGVCIDLSFGYDTLGLVNWKKSNFKNVSALLDGFYIGDWDASGRDISEVVFHSGIAAGASVAGVAGVNVALDLDVNMNFNDPNNDGKIRYFELIENFKNSPLNIFDYSASIEVEAYAYLNYFIGKKKWTLWSSGAMSLFDTASKQGSKPVLLSVENDDTYVNIGRYAQKRNVGDLSDGDDYVDITCSSDSATVSWGKSRLATTGKVDAIATETRKVKGTLYIYAENGKDDIKITSEKEINYNIVIYGGAEDDHIDLSGLKFADGYYAIIEGGAGDDYIMGALKGTNVIFGENGRYKESVVSDKKKIDMVEAYPDVSRGNNVIIGGKDAKNYIFGGGGNDHIVGGDTVTETENYLFGDGGRIVFDSSKNDPAPLRYDLFDEGGEDVIYGGIGRDFIYGGAGKDHIDGGAGKDEIHAGKGNDVVYGGSDNDEIYGDDGVDIIFGDRPADPNMKIAAEDNKSTVLPYFYVSEELKGDGHADVALNAFSLPTNAKYAAELKDFIDNRKVIAPATTLEDGTEVPADVKTIFNDLKNLQNGEDRIHGGFGSDIIFGDDGVNGAESTGKTDYLYGDADNDFIDGDGGNDEIYGDSGADVIYGGQGNDTIDGGADNDVIFGDDGLQGFADSEKGSSTNSLYKISSTLNDPANQEQENVFGYGISSFAQQFGIFSNAKSNAQGGNDTIIAGNGSDIVDGQSGDDSYIVNMKGEANLGYTTVLETGSDASDVLTVNGTSGNDDLLVRASNKGLGSVSLVPKQKDEYTDAEKSKIERVNFWKNAGVENAGVENLSLNAGAGNDTIAIDGTLSTLSIDAGAGDDNIMIGQMFKSDRKNTVEANVADLDEFDTTATSQGFVSNGVQHATSIEGGAGNDTFTLLHTSAALSLLGGAGNDTFNIQSLQHVDSNGNLAGIVMNGPVSVIGGVGHDTLNLAGSDGDDDFVITEEGMQSSGVSVQSVSIEQNNVSGGAGDDSFYVLSSKENTAYYIEGNEGNDSFYNGGVQTDEKYIQVENMDYRGHNGIIEHAVKTDVEAYKGIAADSISVNVIDYDASANNVLFVNSNGQIFEPSCQITEGAGASFLYKVCLSRQPAADETVYVTVFVPSVTVETENRGGKGVLLAQSLNANSWNSSTIVKLTAKNWKSGVSIWAKAESDSLREGSDYVAVLHKVETSNPKDKINTCRNVLVFVNDNKSTAIDATKPFVDADKNLQAGLAVENESVLQLKYTMTDASAKNTTLEVYEDDTAKTLRMRIYAWQSKHIQDLVAKGTLNEQYYVVAGNQIVIRNVDGRAQSISGYVKFSGTIAFNAIVDEKFVASASSVSNVDSSVGQVVIEHSDGSTDVMEPKDKNSTPAYTDYYTISLLGPALTGAQTVDVSITPIATPYEYGSDKKMQQVEVYRITDENGNDLVDADGNVITTFGKVTFSAASFTNGQCAKYRIYVRALADNVHESDALTLIAIGRNSIEKIKGAVYEDGAGVGIDIDLDNPLYINYGTKRSSEKSDHSSDKDTTDERNEASALYKKIRNAAEERSKSIDESKSVDRVFVNNMDNTFNADSSTKALKDDVTALGNNPSDYVKDLKDSDSKLLASDSQSIRFTHTDKSHKNAEDDFAKNISFGNMEYGEINLGSAKDTMDISKSIYREDGFQTFTVVNSGKGDDIVNVTSYKAEQETLVAKISKLFTVSAKAADKYTYVLTAENENVKEPPFDVKSIVNKNGKVYLVAVFSDGVERRAEVDVAKTTVKSIALVHAFDGITDDLKIVSARFAMFQGSDDQLVINAGDGNDKILATDAKNLTREGLIAFGGLGRDEIEIKGNSSLVFGDRGQVLYHDQNGNVVTRLGDDKTGTFIGRIPDSDRKAGGFDYATGKNKGDEAYYQTDGVRYGASIARTVTEDEGENDTISLGNGHNVVFGGNNVDSVVDKNGLPINESVNTGDGEDLVFGDNGYTTFHGRSDVAQGLGMQNLPTIYTEATLSFNFQGPAQTGVGENEQAGAIDDYKVMENGQEVTKSADYRVGNWNNIKNKSGIEAGTYGNEDNEIVLFDNGTRASAVSVTYGATEDHRIKTSDGANIRLHGYDQTPYVSGSNSGDVNLMKSGLDISGNNGRNTLIAQVDGLSQYFTDYDVVVYLDMVREISMHEHSVRVVKLYIDTVDENGELTSTFFDEFYVNDPDDNTFNGSWTIAEGKSVETATVSNCVVFRSFVDANGKLHTISGDRFHVEITDPQNGTNGKDRAGIAGIQVRGRLHKQDVAASTDIEHGGKDIINTNGGDDIVVGGTGDDKITTYGDDRYGIRDNDMVYGDNAKMVFTDRDSNRATIPTISHAESVAATNFSATYDDTINTGDGNDVVVGGVGHDTINTSATPVADAKADDISVVSYNFVRETTDESLLIAPGESAGVVVDNEWHNVYLRNHEMRDRSLNNEEPPAKGAITFEYTSLTKYGNSNNPNEQIDPAMGDDSANNKMLKTLVMGQKEESLTLTLHNLPGTSAAPCDVYVYVGGKMGQSDAYDYVFEIRGFSDGSSKQTFYLNDWMGNSFDGEFKQVKCDKYIPGKLVSGVTPNVDMIGNYVVFRGVTTSDYTVQISCVDSSIGTAHPNDIPVFTAMQVVSGTNRLGDIALGGDHDKDLAIGDDASLDFDLDIPFAADEKISNYKNRVITAESMALSTESVQKLHTNDEIVTGKDRDVVVGGEDGDTILTGSGDDVAIGDSAKLMLENNNPIGVFKPNTEVILEDNQYFDGEKEAYLDNDQVTENQMMQKFNDGKIAGIELLESENGRLDQINVGAGKNLVFQQQDIDTPLFVEPQNDDENQNGDENGDENQSGDNENGTENHGDEGQGVETDVTTIESYLMQTPLTLAAGETVKVVFHEYFRQPSYVPNLNLIVIGSQGQFAPIEVYLDTENGRVPYNIPAEWWFSVDIPDQPNGANGCFEVYFKAKEDTTIMVSIAQ